MVLTGLYPCSCAKHHLVMGGSLGNRLPSGYGRWRTSSDVIVQSTASVHHCLMSQLHVSESIHGMYDVTSGCSIAATLSIAVNGEIGRWAFEMCA